MRRFGRCEQRCSHLNQHKRCRSVYYGKITHYFWISNPKGVSAIFRTPPILSGCQNSLAQVSNATKSVCETGVSNVSGRHFYEIFVKPTARKVQRKEVRELPPLSHKSASEIRTRQPAGRKTYAWSKGRMVLFWRDGSEPSHDPKLDHLPRGSI